MKAQPDDGPSGTTNPTFSILMPSYNPAPYFKAAVSSALEQMAADDELLIQDAGSADGTQEEIAALQAADTRVKAVIEPDAGQSDALNKALARAKCTWIVWLNADDILLPGALDAVREAIVAQPDADVISAAHQIIYADGSVMDVYPARVMELSSLLTRGLASFSGSTVIRADVLRRIGGLRAELHYVMDLELQMRMARQAVSQAIIAAPVGALRFHTASKSGTQWKKFISEGFRLRMRDASSPMEYLYGVWGTFLHSAAIAVILPRAIRKSRKLGG